MTRFVQKHNGSIRRLKGTIGGSSAWKQHVDDSGWENPGERLARIARITDQLAAEELSEALNDRLPSRSSRRRTQFGFRRGGRQQVKPVASAAPVLETAPNSVRNSVRNAGHHTPVAPVKVGPRFKVVISESGTIRAVHLN